MKAVAALLNQMREVRSLFERQAEWQKQRSKLSWPEKIRMAESIRASILKFRRAKPHTKTNK